MPRQRLLGPRKMRVIPPRDTNRRVKAKVMLGPFLEGFEVSNKATSFETVAGAQQITITQCDVDIYIRAGGSTPVEGARQYIAAASVPRTIPVNDISEFTVVTVNAADSSPFAYTSSAEEWRPFNLRALVGTANDANHILATGLRAIAAGTVKALLTVQKSTTSGSGTTQGASLYSSANSQRYLSTGWNGGGLNNRSFVKSTASDTAGTGSTADTDWSAVGAYYDDDGTPTNLFHYGDAALDSSAALTATFTDSLNELIICRAPFAAQPALTTQSILCTMAFAEALTEAESDKIEPGDASYGWIGRIYKGKDCRAAIVYDNDSAALVDLSGYGLGIQAGTTLAENGTVTKATDATVAAFPLPTYSDHENTADIDFAAAYGTSTALPAVHECAFTYYAPVATNISWRDSGDAQIVERTSIPADTTVVLTCPWNATQVRIEAVATESDTANLVPLRE